MKTQSSARYACIAILAFPLLNACGGAPSSSSTAAENASPPVTQDSELLAADGPISGFGSVYVSGVKFDTSIAKIDINGVPSSEDDLDMGMQVQVFGDIDPQEPNRGIARHIIMRDHIRGAIETLDLESSQLTILGTTVQLTENTVYRGTSLEELVTGQSVRVSGVQHIAGHIVASHLANIENGSFDALVRGEIQQLDETRLRFQIDNLMVDYAAAGLIDSADGLQNGDHVVVAGSKDESNGFLLASRIKELDTKPDIAPDDRPTDRRVRIRGLIREILEPGQSYRIRNRVFHIGNSTQYRNGTVNDLHVGAEVMVIGNPANRKEIKARQIVFFHEIDGVVQAAVESIDREKRIISVLGGLKIHVPHEANGADAMVARDAKRAGSVSDSSTARDSEQARRFRFEDLTSGIAIRAVGDWTGKLLIAHSLSRVNFAENRAFLGGYIDSLNPERRSFKLLGVSVLVTDKTNFGDASSARFFANARSGDRIAVRGWWNGTQLLASSIRHARRDRPAVRLDRLDNQQDASASELGDSQ